MSSQPNTQHSTSDARLSVCLIARNEAAIIGDALASVRGWADEIIVIDCESSDTTGEIARQMGAEVHVYPNQENFDLNKNIAFDRARYEWILSFDADEIIPDELKREIDRTIESNPSEKGFKIPRRNFYFGVPLMHGGNYPDRQIRLFRKGSGRFPGNHLHERMVVDGTLGELRQPFDHHPYPTFDVWMRKFMLYTDHEAARLAERNVPITRKTIRHYMVTRPLRRWTERLFLKGGIRDGVPGILAATFDLMNNVVSFGKYWYGRKGEDGG